KAILESLVQGAPAKALDQLNEAGALSLSTIEELNREPERSQKVLDTCLYGVRALLETGSPSSAETQARECRKLVLHGEPSAHMHPPQVLEMLDRVDAARTRQTGALRVESKPSGCAVRVNGLMLGETPIEVRNLFPGRYAVQVECDLDRRGRVHSADVKAAPTDVFVDSRFDLTLCQLARRGAASQRRRSRDREDSTDRHHHAVVGAGPDGGRARAPRRHPPEERSVGANPQWPSRSDARACCIGGSHADRRELYGPDDTATGHASVRG
ncbi:MAG: PEGA domain-containing protein, partial [Deltaproteobacteria bacterium]|nr:PEGA domain-containing protein [Deltaproteobacteria bacterium]